MKTGTAAVVVDVCRGFQLILGACIFALSISLTIRWSELSTNCSDPAPKECDKMKNGLGGLEYSIFVGAWALLDIIVGAVDEFVYKLPWCLARTSAGMAGSFALSGACTLTALVNDDWHCGSNGKGGLRLCNQFYANIVFQYMTLIVGWTTCVALWHIEKNKRDKRTLSRVDSRMS